MDLNKLKEPFPAEDIEWRLQQCGSTQKGIWAKCLAYVTNRAIMNRLDEVCGPENWKNEFSTAPDGGVLCGISIKVNDSWITKYDGAENTDIEGVKGGLSGSMKRAAVQWGIGRYLYNLDEGWATISDDGQFRGKTKDGTPFKWNAPILPNWALPGGSGKPDNQKTSAPKNPRSQTSNGNPQSPTGAAPAFPETPESKQLKNSLLDWIATGVLQGSYMKKAELHMYNNDVKGMNAVIDWCKSQQQSA